MFLELEDEQEDISYDNFVGRSPEIQQVEATIQLPHFAKQAKVRNIELEYKLLKLITETKMHQEQFVATTSETSMFNRYNDVVPYRTNCVELNTGKYINASFIDGFFGQDQFIATQGPLPSSRDTFWQLVWDYQCPLIVMLCSVMEGGRAKCDQYFPTEGILATNNYEITLLKESNPFPNLIARKLRLRALFNGEERILKHMQSTSWPDHGAPELSEENDALNYLIQVMKAKTDE